MGGLADEWMNNEYIDGWIEGVNRWMEDRKNGDRGYRMGCG